MGGGALCSLLFGPDPMEPRGQVKIKVPGEIKDQRRDTSQKLANISEDMKERSRTGREADQDPLTDTPPPRC